MENTEFKIHEFDVKKSEPLRQNNFIVDFPDKYQIPHWAIRYFNFLGKNEIEIKIMEVVGSNYINRFKSMPKISDINITLLDITKYPLLNLNFKKIKVIDIIPDKLSYNTDGIFEIKLKCKYKKLIIKELNK